MMKLDLVDCIVSYLAEEGFRVSKKRFDAFTGKEGSYIYLMPATTAIRYMDGRKDIDQPYTVVVKRRSEQEAMEECQDIEQALDMAVIDSKNGSYRMVVNTVYVGSQEVDLDDANFYAWQASFIAEIVRR